MNTLYTHHSSDPNWLQRIDPSREYYWKRTDGWDWNGAQRWWEVFVVFSNGFNGAGGACITELWRWNGSQENVRTQPRNLSYNESEKLVDEILSNEIEKITS